MNVSAPAAAAKPMPTAPKVPTEPTGPAVPTTPTSGPAKPVPADEAASKNEALDKLMKTSALDAMTQVDEQLTKVATLTVGGGTPDGTKAAQAATSLLTDASIMLQHANVQAVQQLHNLAAQLQVQLMSSASSLAFLGGQIAVASQAKTPVKLADVAKGQIDETRATMAEVTKALAPATPAPTEPPAGTPAPAPAPAPASPAPPQVPAAEAPKVEMKPAA